MKNLVFCSWYKFREITGEVLSFPLIFSPWLLSVSANCKDYQIRKIRQSFSLSTCCMETLTIFCHLICVLDPYPPIPHHAFRNNLQYLFLSVFIVSWNQRPKHTGEAGREHGKTWSQGWIPVPWDTPWYFPHGLIFTSVCCSYNT